MDWGVKREVVETEAAIFQRPEMCKAPRSSPSVSWYLTTSTSHCRLFVIHVLDGGDIIMLHSICRVHKVCSQVQPSPHCLRTVHYSVFMSSHLVVSPKYSRPNQLLISAIWVLKLVDVKLYAAFQGHSPSNPSTDYAGTGRGETPMTILFVNVRLKNQSKWHIAIFLDVSNCI